MFWWKKPQSSNRRESGFYWVEYKGKETIAEMIVWLGDENDRMYGIEWWFVPGVELNLATYSFDKIYNTRIVR